MTTKLDELQAASNAFYNAAVRAGVHPFIEFTGLMNEWIKAARRQPERMHGSVHTGDHVQLEIYEIRYIREKLECIFGKQVTRPSASQLPASRTPSRSPARKRRNTT